MKQYEEIFFSILRASLWKTPVEIPEGFDDWGKVLKLAKTQALTGLIGDVILTNPSILSKFPSQVVAKLQDMPLTNMGTHTVLNNTLILVVSKLREHGIEPVLLKGQGIAQYYPVPALRQCGDIDLYVGVENYKEAYEALFPLFTEVDDKSALDIGVHFHAKIGSVQLEIHRYADRFSSIRLDSIFQSYAKEGLTKDLIPIDFGSVSVNTPADNFNVYFIFAHLWRHFMEGGVGLRQFCDWMMLLRSKKDKISLQYLNAILTDMKLMEPWQVFGCVLVDYLGMPSDEFPLFSPYNRKKAGSVIKRVLREGNFGQNTTYARRRTKYYIYEKLFSLWCHISRFSQLIFLFPYLTLRQIYHVIVAGTIHVFHDINHKS